MANHKTIVTKPMGRPAPATTTSRGPQAPALAAANRVATDAAKKQLDASRARLAAAANVTPDDDESGPAQRRRTDQRHEHRRAARVIRPANS
jgi:hypothetical protein